MRIDGPSSSISYGLLLLTVVQGHAHGLHRTGCGSAEALH